MIFKLKNNRVWRTYLGGRKIDRLYNVSPAVDGHYPEEWIASTVIAKNPGRNIENEGLSVTESGAFLLNVIQNDIVSMLGETTALKYGGKMPVLVKLLDSAERLVIQVHPTVAFAKEHFGSDFGKTECWYILDTDKDACVHLGFKKGITKEKWMKCFDDQDSDEMLNLLHKVKVKKGDLVFVAGGIPHAIGAGCLLLELQEPTDLMVIPEKKTPSGLELSNLKIHGGLGFEKMFDCFEYTSYTENEIYDKFVIKPYEIQDGRKILLDEHVTDCFRLEEINVKDTLTVHYPDIFIIAVVIEGEGLLTENDCTIRIACGDQLFIPACAGNLLWKCLKNKLRVVLCMPST